MFTWCSICHCRRPPETLGSAHATDHLTSPGRAVTPPVLAAAGGTVLNVEPVHQVLTPVLGKNRTGAVGPWGNRPDTEPKRDGPPP
jgi:hypothetical protein